MVVKQSITFNKNSTITLKKNVVYYKVTSYNTHLSQAYIYIYTFFHDINSITSYLLYLYGCVWTALTDLAQFWLMSFTPHMHVCLPLLVCIVVHETVHPIWRSLLVLRFLLCVFRQIDWRLVKCLAVCVLGDTDSYIHPPEWGT